jgi:hypothetical protein
MTGIERLRRVRGHLPEAKRGTKPGLKKAAAEFDAAYRADSQDWPMRFRMRAGVIRDALTRDGGTDETIDGLRSADLTEAAASLRQFCDDAEHATR